MEESFADSLLRNFQLFYSELPETNLPFMLIIFLVFLYLLYAIINAKEGGIHYVANERVPLDMRRVLNPFTIHINSQSTDSLDVSCTLSSIKPCYVLPFWGVPGSVLFEVLKLDPIAMKQAFTENYSSFKNKCLASSPSIRLDNETKVLSFLPPPFLYEDESINQRLYLPLVIVMFLDEGSIINDEDPMIFVQATIVHVPSVFKHPVVTNEENRGSCHHFNVSQNTPSILGSYVKEPHLSTVGLIRKVYDGSYSENLNGEVVPVCVACCQRRVNTVIFPCLHASVCTLCYYQCEVCPTCRGPVFYYFTTGPIVELPQENS